MNKIWIVEGAAVIEGKIVRPANRDGDAHVLLVDGRTVVRQARFGVFTSEAEAAGYVR